jgi:hypothetical protein
MMRKKKRRRRRRGRRRSRRRMMRDQWLGQVQLCLHPEDERTSSNNL